MRRALIAVTVAGLAACASTPPQTSPELDALRARLEAMQKDPQIGGLAPVAMVEADRAIDAAEASLAAADGELEQKLYLANSRLAIARAHAQRRSVENRIRKLSLVEEQAVPVSQEVEGVIAIPPPELRPEPVAPRPPELPPAAVPEKSKLPPPPSSP